MIHRGSRPGLGAGDETGIRRKMYAMPTTWVAGGRDVLEGWRA